MPIESGESLRSTQVDSVYLTIGAAILRGDFISGEPLGQVALARELGVSRILVREALQRLGSSCPPLQVEPVPTP